MLGAATAGASRASSGRPRLNMSGTSQSVSESSSAVAQAHRHSMSDSRLDTDDTPVTSTGRRSAFLEPLPLSRSPSATNGCAVSSPTSPSTATGKW